METDPRRNPALLKLELFCKGLRLDDSCFIERDGGRPILRTRAGLGSGLELVLPGGLWTNAPVAEKFAAESPYVLHAESGRYVIRSYGVQGGRRSARTSPIRHGVAPSDDVSSSSKEGSRPGLQVMTSTSEPIATVSLAPRPSWYDLKTSTGKTMSRIGTLQGTYLGVYPARVCEYWTEKPKSNCKFCSVGLNLGADDDDEKAVNEVLEVVHAARRESAITYVDFNTGHYEGDTYLDILEPYVRRVRDETGLLIGVQCPPHHDLRRYDRLRAIGVNRVSFCFEIFDPTLFQAVCPGKDREYGLDRYLEAVRYCARLGKEKRSLSRPWVTNGEIIAGLEPAASSISAIDWVAGVGAIPTVCVFRPLAGTDMEDAPPPKTEEMVPVFRRLYEACMENDLPIGLAPNIHVSLVLLPEECRWFLDEPRKYWRKELRLKAQSSAFRFGFGRRLRQADRAFPGGTARGLGPAEPASPS